MALIIFIQSVANKMLNYCISFSNHLLILSCSAWYLDQIIPRFLLSSGKGRFIFLQMAINLGFPNNCS